MEYIATFDVGTTAVKGVLVDLEGHAAASCTVPSGHTDEQYTRPSSSVTPSQNRHAPRVMATSEVMN